MYELIYIFIYLINENIYINKFRDNTINKINDIKFYTIFCTYTYMYIKFIQDQNKIKVSENC